MSENQQIAKYITNFSCLATQIRWGTSALRYQFYKGLPARLKDRISKVRKPSTLEELQNVAQALNYCYWERKAEQFQESPGSHKSGQKSSNSKSDSKMLQPAKSGFFSSQNTSSSTPSKLSTSSTPKAQSKAPAKP